MSKRNQGIIGAAKMQNRYVWLSIAFSPNALTTVARKSSTATCLVLAVPALVAAIGWPLAIACTPTSEPVRDIETYYRTVLNFLPLTSFFSILIAHVWLTLVWLLFRLTTTSQPDGSIENCDRGAWLSRFRLLLLVPVTVVPLMLVWSVVASLKELADPGLGIVAYRTPPFKPLWLIAMKPMVDVLGHPLVGLAILVWGSALGVRGLFCLERLLSDRALRCPSCDYNLTGNVSGVCPECGTPIDARQHRAAL